MTQLAQFVVRAIAADRIADRDVPPWVALESRAVEPNAYLSPYFVRAAARHVTPEHPPLVLFVERRAAGGSELLGAAVLTKAGPSLRFPACRLRGYQTPFNFVGGMLLDRECPAAILEALLAHVRKSMPRCGALELPFVWDDGPIMRLSCSLGRSAGYRARIAAPTTRSILVPAHAQEQLQSKPLAQRMRDLARRRRRLEERGAVGWRWYRHDGVPQSAIEDFLVLEHAGWKGSRGSSLRSRAAHEAFFREMVAGFAAEGRAIFTELTLDGEPIASATNFLSGNRGFGFKIGWNPAFRTYSPGVLNEVEFMRHAGTIIGDVDFMESGATANSFIDELWRERRTLSTLAIPLRLNGAIAVGSIALARAVKRCLGGAGARISSRFRRHGALRSLNALLGPG